MKRACGLLLVLGLSLVLRADRANVTRGALGAMERSLDAKLLKQVLDDNPFLLPGMTRAVYIEGFGVVFSAELNLVQGPTVSPFHPKATKEDLARLRQRKLERLPALKSTMREMLVASAGGLDGVPADEQVVLGVTLLNMSWEDARGLPSQIVMQAQRRVLVGFQTGRRDRAQLDSAVKVLEY